MRIINEGLLQEFREKMRCELCRTETRSGADPHHVWARGHGGGHRADVRINLIALCRACHSEYHAGLIGFAEVAVVVAERERSTVDAITEAVWLIQRIPPRSHRRTIERMLGEVEAAVADLVRRELSQ